MALLTTTVGWFPKPVALRRARWLYSEGEIGRDELRAAEEQARGELLALQQELGLGQWVDGQVDRGDMISHFADALEGMEPAGLVRCFDNRYYRKPRIVGDVEHTGPITVDAWSSAQASSALPVKALLTGPYTLMDWSYDEHYGSREKCCMALAEAIRAEAEALLAAGAKEIEIDEPALSVRPEEMALVAAALDVVTGPLRGKARSWVHIGYGDPLAVLEAIYRLPVDGLLVEMANSGFPLLGRLGELPEDKLLGAGVVDVHTAEVESAAVVQGRVERLLGEVPAERLWLMPDGGLRALPAAAARGKLEAIVEAAAALG